MTSSQQFDFKEFNVKNFTASFSLLTLYNASAGKDRPRIHRVFIDILEQEMEIYGVEGFKVTPANADELPPLFLRELKIPKEVKTFYIINNKDACMLHARWTEKHDRPPATLECETVYAFVNRTVSSRNKIKLSWHQSSVIAAFLSSMGEVEHLSPVQSPWGGVFMSPSFLPCAYRHIAAAFHPSTNEFWLVGRNKDVYKPLVKLF